MNILSASLWLSLSELVFNLSGYLIHSFLGRFLGPAEYGRYGLIITLSTMIVVLLSRGIPIAMSKYLAEIGTDKSKLDKILFIKKISWRAQILITLTITLVYFSLIPFFTWVFGDNSLKFPLQLSTLIIPAFSLATFYVYYFVGIQQFKKQALLKMSRAVLKVIAILSGAFVLSLEGAILGHALAPFLIFLIALSIDPYRSQKPSKNFHFKNFSWQKLFAFAWPVTLFMIFYELMLTTDIYLVKALLKNDELTGLYNAALTIGRLPYYALYFLTLILLPKVSEAVANKSKAELSALLTKTIKTIILLLFPTIALIAAFSPSAILLFYGQKFLAAGTTLSILALGMGFYTLYYILAFILNGAGHNKIPMQSALLGVIINFGLSFFLIQKMGITGAAWANNISAGIIMLWLIYAVEKKVASFLLPKTILEALLLSLLIFFLAKNYLAGGQFLFIFWSVLLMLAYLAILFLLKEVSKNDLLAIKLGLRKKKR